MYGRKRTYGSRARSQSAPAKKKAKKSFAAPRFKTLYSNRDNGRKQFIRTKTIYSDWFTIDPPIASAGVYVFSANGLYDPNITGVGHQVNGFDQFMALYNEYIVLGSTIKVVARNIDTALPTCVGVFLEDAPTTTTDWRKYIESGNGVWTCIEGTSNSNAIRTLSHSADISKFSTQSIFNEDSFIGTASTNPDDQHYFHIVAWPHDGVSNCGGVQFQIEIRYDVVYRDPNLADLS